MKALGERIPKMYDTWVKTWCLTAAAIFKVEILGNPKPWFLALKPSPMNAGQVWHLDLCATLGICDQLFKVKMAKL